MSVRGLDAWCVCGGGAYGQVVFPSQLKLNNTTDAAAEEEASFSLFAVVVHVGRSFSLSLSLSLSPPSPFQTQQHHLPLTTHNRIEIGTRYSPTRDALYLATSSPYIHACRSIFISIHACRSIFSLGHTLPPLSSSLVLPLSSSLLPLSLLLSDVTVVVQRHESRPLRLPCQDPFSGQKSDHCLFSRMSFIRP